MSRLEKYIDEKFDGPWFMMSGMLCSPQCVGIVEETALSRYNKLHAAYVAMAEDYNRKHPEDFKAHYYGERS